MKIEEHLAKAQRVLNSANKFRFPEDYLAIVDSAMIAGYHLGNALLHKHGISAPNQHFNAASHLEAGVNSLPLEIQPAFKAFAELERLRFEFVRSPSQYDSNLSKLVPQYLNLMKRANAL